jgi:hypothetical protein
MCSRLIAWSCCLLIVLAPTLVIASVTEHAHQHHEAAAAGSGHSNEHGDVPHRDHDGNGDPIPVLAQHSFWATRPAIDAGLQVPAPLPAPFLTLPTQPRLDLTLLAARDFADRRSRSPTTPSPGDILPLLI